MFTSHDHSLAEALRPLLDDAADYEGRARGTDLFRPQLYLREIVVMTPTDARGLAVEPQVLPVPVAPALNPAICERCGAVSPLDARFCVDCGHPRPATVALSNFQIVQLREDGSDGTVTTLPVSGRILGREGDLAFPADALLSERHARLSCEGDRLFVEDLKSLNGTFLKLRNEHRLQLGDTLILGRQVLRFERVEQVADPRARDAEGTRYMGSPSPGAQFRLVQVGAGGVVQNAYLLYDTATSIGRERGDLVFPRDRFMSGRHAEGVARSDGHFYLIDKGSSNGTWVKLWDRTELQPGDRILVGQQTFRVEAT